MIRFIVLRERFELNWNDKFGKMIFFILIELKLGLFDDYNYVLWFNVRLLNLEVSCENIFIKLVFGFVF